MGKSSDISLESLARRTEGDSFFVSYALAQYKAMHRVGDEQLMRILACTRRALDRLALCRLPDDHDPGFREQVQQIAAFVSCNADHLMRVFRDVAAVASLREPPAHRSMSGLLLAARDRRAGEGAGRPDRVKTKKQKR
jgi:hypothetical protein